MHFVWNCFPISVGERRYWQRFSGWKKPKISKQNLTGMDKGPFVQKLNTTSCILTDLFKTVTFSFFGMWKWLTSQSKLLKSLMNLNEPISKHILSLGFVAKAILCMATSEIWQKKKILWPLLYLLKRSIIFLIF